MNKVLFIVEGQTEQQIYENILGSALEPEILCEVAKTDITTNYDYSHYFGEGLILQFLKNKKIVDIKNYDYIIMITDTDGCFISDSDIIYSENKRVQYTNTCIKTNKREKIIKRNRNKREKIDSLLNCYSVCGVTFKLFFNSTNLEHVMHNIQQVKRPEDKTKLALDILKRYKGCEADFLDFLKSSDICSGRDYNDSWDYIGYGVHSLSRQTNLKFFLDEICKHRNRRKVNKMNIVKNETFK